MKRSRIIPALLAGLVFTQGASAAACLAYEPQSVALKGKLHRQTFPGAPNFESVAQGDQAETGFYLTLPAPVCTISGGDDQEAFAAVREVQLVLDKQQYAELRPQLGKTVSLHGKLFARFSGHHHADILLRVAH